MTAYRPLRPTLPSGLLFLMRFALPGLPEYGQVHVTPSPDPAPQCSLCRAPFPAPRPAESHSSAASLVRAPRPTLPVERVVDTLLLRRSP